MSASTIPSEVPTDDGAPQAALIRDAMPTAAEWDAKRAA